MRQTIERPGYMSELEEFRDDRDCVKVITGVRRCGKSTLLIQFMEKLKSEGVREDEMLMMNFESSEFDPLTDFNELK